ncbi:preprotein translocase subunit YajC [Akkermansiaceae bacterium]|nr:preprotein translocase subunit YajC [Akkermansiaceae bacterium]
MINTLSNVSAIFGAANPLGGGFILPLVMIVVFWVVLIRPQQKQRKETAARQAALKKGDKIITIGGMHATVNAVSEKTVSLKLSDGIFVKYDKTSIATVVSAKSNSTEETEVAK